jgi:hypothetical protein
MAVQAPDKKPAVPAQPTDQWKAMTRELHKMSLNQPALDAIEAADKAIEASRKK